MALSPSRIAHHALLLVSLVLAACGGGNGEQEPPPDDEVAPENLETLTVTFGPSGGTLSFADGASFEVPAYALDRETAITASRWKVPADGAEHIEYRLEPTGIVFARPATLRLALPPGAVNSEGWAVGFSPSKELERVSLGRLPDAQRVAAKVVETGHATVVEDTGVRSVIGVAIPTYLARDGSIQHLAATVVERSLLLISRHPDGTREEKRAEIQPSGTFRFDGVPDGSYELRGLRPEQYWDGLATFAIQSDASTLDLGETTLVRPAAKVPTADSPLSIVFEAPDAPGQFDSFMLVSAETNRLNAAWWTDYAGPGPLFQTGMALNRSARLLDAREGDVLSIVRRVDMTASTGLLYRASKDWAHLKNVIQEEGAETGLLARLEPAPYNRTLSVTVRTSDFLDAVRSLADVSGCIVWGQGHLYSALGPVAQGDSAPFATSRFKLELLGFSVDRDLSEHTTGLLRYGSDQATHHADYFDVTFYGHRGDHLLPGTTSAPLPRQCAYLNVRLPLDTAQAAPIGPRLSPPAKLRANGEDAGADYLAIGPGDIALDWDAPELGVPTSYRLNLRTFYAEADSTRERLTTLELITAERQWTLSPDLLQGAEAFSVMIEATQMDSEAPFRASHLGAMGRMETGLIHIVE